MRLLTAAFFLVAASASIPAPAQESAGGIERFGRWAVDDLRQAPEAFGWREAGYAAAVGALVATWAPYDPAASEVIRPLGDGHGYAPLRVVEELGNVRAVRPATALVFVGSLMSGRRRFQDAAFTSMQAVLLADLTTRTLKLTFGRARPYQALGAQAFEPFSGRSSFPSGHATTAFALATPWLLYYPNAWTIGFVGLSTGTALSRVATNVHWLSDVLAGALIGSGWGYYLARRHQQGAPRVLVAPRLEGGRGVGITVRLGGDGT